MTTSSQDDITLEHLFGALWRQRRWIGGIFILVGGLGLISQLTRPPQYDYTTTLEIGRTVERDVTINGSTGQTQSDGIAINTGAVRPLELVFEVRAKLESAYAPAVMREQLERSDNLGVPPELEIDRSGDRIVMLTSTGPETLHADHQAIHEATVARIVADHEPLVAAERARLQRRLDNALAQQRRAASRLEAAAGGGDADTDAPDAVPAQLSAERRDALAAQQAQAATAAAEYRRRLEAVQPTQAVAMAEQSIEPVNASMALRLGLSFVIAAVVAVLGGGIRELLQRRRRGPAA